MDKKQKQPTKTCDDCIHESACRAWVDGRYIADSSASRCPNFETVQESAAYLCGVLDERKRKQTNADRIRSMSDEELAWELMTWRLEAVARHHGVESQYPNTQQTILSWLQQPVKEMSDDLAYYTACNLHPGCSIGQFDPGRAEG